MAAEYIMTAYFSTTQGELPRLTKLGVAYAKVDIVVDRCEHLDMYNIITKCRELIHETHPSIPVNSLKVTDWSSYTKAEDYDSKSIDLNYTIFM